LPFNTFSIMKLLQTTAAAVLMASAFGAVMDPCNFNGYPAGATSSQGIIDAYKVTWNDAMSSNMNRRACHSCENCKDDALSAIPYVEDCQYPNGFRTAQVYMDNEPPFCLTVDNAGGSMVQVLLETEESDDRLCVESQGTYITRNNGVTVPAQCGEGQINACFPGEDGGSLKLLVYCDESCPETSIVFKYKVMHSVSRANYDQADAAVGNVDMWCMMQDGTTAVMWPSEMQADTPESIPMPVKLYNGASTATASVGFVVTALAALAAMQ